MASSSSVSRTEKSVPFAGYLYPPRKELRLQFFTPFQPFGNSCYKSPFDKDSKCGEASDISKVSTEDYVFTKSSRQRGDMDLTPDHAKAYLYVHTKQNPVKASLRVIGGISMSKGLGSQVLLCEVLLPPTKLWTAMGHRPSDHPSKFIVAKVFDPLYYPTATPWNSHMDVVSLAEKAFAHEAAAYMELHHGRKENTVVNDFVPKFYGTFSYTIHREGAKEPDSDHRPVRIVLMEFIQGQTIVDMSEASYNNDNVLVRQPPMVVGDKLALQVFQRVLHGLTSMEKLGVFHQNMDSSNVIVSIRPGRDGKDTTLGRVVMVDFDRSRVQRYTEKGEHLAQVLEKPLHPVVRFHLGGSLGSFAGWFPVAWLTECDERQSMALDDYESDHDEEYDIDKDPRLLLWEKWAYKVMTKKEFIMGDEASIIAHDRRVKQEAAEAAEAKEAERARQAEEAKKVREAREAEEAKKAKIARDHERAAEYTGRILAEQLEARASRRRSRGSMENPSSYGEHFAQSTTSSPRGSQIFAASPGGLDSPANSPSRREQTSPYPQEFQLELPHRDKRRSQDSMSGSPTVPYTEAH